MKKYLILFVVFLEGFCLSAQEYQSDISVHDPVMIRQNNRYYLFSTGWGINVWSSTDMKSWKKEKPVFSKAPEWAVKDIPAFKGHIWAPDIYFYSGKYYLYYSISTFGKNTSAIGVAVNQTLDPDSPDFKWIDYGKVIQSFPGKTNWNAIDPNVIRDENDVPWMVFGSFWDGIKLVQLSKDMLHISTQKDILPTIASRKKDPEAPNPPSIDANPVDAGGNAIEAPFLFKKNGYYYLFASIDYCCKGEKSTYKIIIGRSSSIKGPFFDQKNVEMNKGGGTLVLEGNTGWYGVGHNAVCSFDGEDYLIFHGYDAKDKGVPKLRIEKLNWLNGWPLIVEK
ncbi:family 43 glycosylhydrolase [Pedobacter sp. NJ-S-72]